MHRIKIMIKFSMVVGLMILLAQTVSGKEAVSRTEQELKNASEFYQAEDWAQAYQAFENIYIKDSKNIAALNGMAWCKFKTGNIKKAQAMFKSILRKDPYFTDAKQGIAAVDAKIYGRFNQALMLYNKGRFDESLPTFQAVLDDQNRLMPESELWRVLLYMGHNYLGRKQPESAVKYYQKSIDHTDNFAAHKQIGIIEYEQKNYKDAISSFEASLKLYPAQYDVKSMTAWCLLRDGSTDKAIERFSKMITINPYVADTHYGLGLAYYKKDKLQLAREQFYSVISLLPGYLANDEFYTLMEKTKEYRPLYADLGWALYFAGLTKQSLKTFEKGLDIEPENADLLRGAGYAAYILKDYNRAIAYCRKSLSQNSRLSAVYETSFTQTGIPYRFYSNAESTAAWAYFQKKDYTNAKIFFKRAISSHPKWPDALSGLGWVLYSQKNWDDAEKYFKAAIETDPSYRDAYTGATAVAKARIGRSGEGWKYYYLSQFEKAVNQFKAVTVKKSATADEKRSAIRGLGWSHLKNGSNNKAAAYFNTLIKNNDNDFDAVLGLGLSQYEQKKYKTASKTLKTAVERFPYDINASIAYAWSLYYSQKYKNCAAQFQKSIQLAPRLADPYRGYGFAMVKLGRVDEGKLSIIKAINMFPKAVDNAMFEQLAEDEAKLKDLYITFAWSYYNFGLYSDAIRTAEKIEVEYPDKDMLLGFIYSANKQYNNSISHLEQFLSDPPEAEKGYGKFSKSYSHLGWSYYHVNNYSKALATFKKLAALHADDDIWAAPYDGMGWSYLKIGNRNDADISFKESLKRAPGYTSSLAGLKELNQ